MADLAKYKVTDEAVKMFIKNPETEETEEDFYLLVVSLNSDRVRKASHALNNKLRKKINIKGSKVDGIQTSEESEADTLHLLSKTITGWSGVMENGTELDYTEENAKYLLKSYPFIREQLDDFLKDDQAFFKSA